jgi:hypothetical protein
MRLLMILVLAVTLGACTPKAESPKAEPKRAATSAPTPVTPGQPDQPDQTEQPDMSDTKACAEVRAGIDDFNQGEFAGTVEHFRTALPLARQQAQAHPSRSARDLVDAVTYYAELAPDDYLASSGSSLEFAKYKAITLGQCVVGTEQPGGSGSPGVTT